ncbi:MAG TPA: hypothetical protein VMR50_01210 [Myxococcota bacterium]|nr:hypothetical protein [Myxococcota bacterium]
MAEIEAVSPRRVFVEPHELPALVMGTALGTPAACRRVLGARRGGRYGFLLALLGLSLAAPTLRLAGEVAALHVLLTLATGLANRGQRSHTTREVQRLALWTVLVPLAVAALARHWLGGAGLPLAAVAGQLCLWRALAATRS